MNMLWCKVSHCCLGTATYDHLRHLFYTIPPAGALTLVYSPLRTSIDVYKILFLVAVSFQLSRHVSHLAYIHQIAVVSTTPWDSYLIRNRIWTYPDNVIVGPTLFSIPAEEVFFFIIQTYNTSLLYLLISKPTFHPVYLRGKRLLHHSRRLRIWRWIGTLAILAGIALGISMIASRGKGLYMGLILVWAGPFILLLWSLAYQFILGLPMSNTMVPIVLPTLYLWVVDTMALKRGTWVIESVTKLGWHFWDGLEIEEAVFFLVTNVLIVFGLVAFDNALAILYAFPTLFPSIPSLPSPILLVQALLTPTCAYDDDRIDGMQQALARLRAKSRSFYLASGVFQGRLRIDLILLYSFCRIADDLVDDAASTTEAQDWIVKLSRFLDLSYSDKRPMVSDYVIKTFPPSAQAGLLLLPTTYLSPTPLYELLKGFETDIFFKSSDNPFPIKDQVTLELYGARVAGTVAESCIELAYYHTKVPTSDSERKQIARAGGQMGIALQFVNIARDISVDASNDRVYLPSSWLKGHGLSSDDIIRDPTTSKVDYLRQQLLDNAMRIYKESKGAIEQLPREARGPMRVAVESYVEIGRVLRVPGYKVKAGRATVPKLRRLKVAWNALNQ